MMNGPNGQPTVEYGEHRGIAWCITKGGGPGGCGYVLIPPEHPWRKVEDQEDLPVSIHGGITFSSHDWIGFDTLHGGLDLWPDAELDRLGVALSLRWEFPSFGGTQIEWTVEKLVEETKALADQVAEAMS